MILLHQVEKAKDRTVLYSGVERTNWLMDPETKQPYLQRWLYIHSTGLEKTSMDSFQTRLEELKKHLDDISNKSNTKWYGTTEKIETAVKSALSKGKFTAEIITYTIHETIEIVEKKKKGRSSAGTPVEVMEKKVLKLEYKMNEEEITKLKRRCGYFVLVTNK